MRSPRVCIHAQWLIKESSSAESTVLSFASLIVSNFIQHIKKSGYVFLQLEKEPIRLKIHVTRCLNFNINFAAAHSPSKWCGQENRRGSQNKERTYWQHTKKVELQLDGNCFRWMWPGCSWVNCTNFKFYGTRRRTQCSEHADIFWSWSREQNNNEFSKFHG